MKKIFIKFLIALCLLVALIPLSIIEYISLVEEGVIVNSDNREFQEKLKQKLESGAEEIRIKDLTNFEWDEANIFTEIDYKTNELIEDYDAWTIAFYLKNKKVNRFKIKKDIVELKIIGASIKLIYDFHQADFFKIKSSKNKKFITLK